MSSMVCNTSSDHDSCVMKKVDQQLCCTLAKYFSKRTEEERDKTTAMLAKLNAQLQQNEEIAKKLNSANLKLERMKYLHKEKVNIINQLTESEQLLTKKVGVLESHLQDLKEACAEKDKKILVYEKELSKPKDKTEEMSEHIAALSEELTAVKEENSMFSSAVAPVMEKYQQLNIKILEFEKKLETSRKILYFVDQNHKEITKFLMDEININCKVLKKCSKLIINFIKPNEMNKDVDNLFKAMEKVCQTLKNRLMITDLGPSLIIDLNSIEILDVSDSDFECYKDLTKEIDWFKRAITHLMKVVDETHKQKITQNYQEETVNKQLSEDLEKCKKNCTRLKDKFDAKNRELYSLTIKYSILRQKLVVDEESEKLKSKSSRKRIFYKK